MNNTTAYQTILRAEMEHLKPDSGRYSLLRRGFVSIMVLIALTAFAWRVIDTIPQQPSFIYWLLTELKLDTTNYFGNSSNGSTNNIVTTLMLLFSLGVVIWNFWLMLQTLVMSRNSISRERNAKSWELLLLTGISVRQIVRAKWWAIVRRQWKDYTLLAILQIGAVSFLAMNFGVNFWFGDFPWFSYGSTGPSTEPDRTIVFLIAISIVLLSAALIAVLTMLNLMFTAACGLVGGSITQRLSLALPSSIGIRLFLMIGIAILAGVPSYLVLKVDIETSNYYPNPVLSTLFLILGLVGTTIVDNGGIAAGLLMRFGYNVRWWGKFYGIEFFSDTLRGHGPAFLTALLLSVLIFAGLTYTLLRRAEKIITQ